MNSNLALYNTICNQTSEYTSKKYSTSFYSSIQLLHKSLHQHIYNIYGFVRFADEIVDTFHEYDKQLLFCDFKNQTYQAIEQQISLNPILHSFQQTVHAYQIDKELIDAFLFSMELDLTKETYTETEYQQYIYGSAEVVGLMCLKVFCERDVLLYKKLVEPARKLGAAFQKINFLRDIKADAESLGRMYFPNCDFNTFTQLDKAEIEKDIANDFSEALQGIKQLNSKSQFGVYVAYKYYFSLFKKIKSLPAQTILNSRIRNSNFKKFIIIIHSYLNYKLNWL
ncbi:MAG: phytoene/squalene synthase family protein [Chitinophagaceae bacterium]|nr:phytoene/squalene synthase family protein [Chitinophagaceae bacterium]